MTVLEALGVAVSVVMDGETAQEYDDPDPLLQHKGKKIDPAVTAVCNKYIMAKDDTEYLVRLEVLPQNTWLGKDKTNILEFAVYIDGEWRCGTPFRDMNLRSGYGKVDKDKTTTRNSDGWSKRRFSFGTITATDAADIQMIESDAKRAAHMGTIRVTVQRRRYLKYRPRREDEHKEGDLTIAEKALKGQAVSHGTIFSHAEACTRPRGIHSKKIDDHPMAIFNFKYRSKDALRQEMVVPRTPSPTPAQIVAGLDRAELERIAIERMTETRIKRESQLQGVKTEPGVKTERGTQSRPVKRDFADAFDSSRDSSVINPQPLRKMARLSNGRLQIDLTDD